VEVTDVETDCDDPKNPARRTVDDTVTEAAERLAKRLLGS
jgi:hypothetical protein